MDSDKTARLLVTCAGREWLFEVDRTEEARLPDDACREIVSWMGPWARVLSASETLPELSGRVTLSAAAKPGTPGSVLPDGEPGIHSVDSGTEVRLKEFSISMPRDDAAVTAVRYQPGKALAAAHSTLRLLAIRAAVSAGGLAMHASSVRTPAGVLVFAGPTGTGKTTAAGKFPASDILDEDLVLAAGKNGRWVRLNMPNLKDPRRFGPQDIGELPIQAVFIPYPAASFRADSLEGADAAKACLHLPPPALAPGNKAGASMAAEALSGASRLASSVKIARLGWTLSDDLPALLSRLTS